MFSLTDSLPVSVSLFGQAGIRDLGVRLGDHNQPFSVPSGPAPKAYGFAGPREPIPARDFRTPPLGRRGCAYGRAAVATTGRPGAIAGRPTPAAAQSSAGPPRASPGRYSARNTCPPIRAVRLSAANQGHRPASISAGLTK